MAYVGAGYIVVLYGKSLRDFIFQHPADLESW